MRRGRMAETSYRGARTARSRRFAIVPASRKADMQTASEQYGATDEQPDSAPTAHADDETQAPPSAFGSPSPGESAEADEAEHDGPGQQDDALSWGKEWTARLSEPPARQDDDDTDPYLSPLRRFEPSEPAGRQSHAAGRQGKPWSFRLAPRERDRPLQQPGTGRRHRYSRRSRSWFAAGLIAGAALAVVAILARSPVPAPEPQGSSLQRADPASDRLPEFASEASSGGDAVAVLRDRAPFDRSSLEPQSPAAVAVELVPIVDGFEPDLAPATPRTPPTPPDGIESGGEHAVVLETEPEFSTPAPVTAPASVRSRPASDHETARLTPVQTIERPAGLYPEPIALTARPTPTAATEQEFPHLVPLSSTAASAALVQPSAYEAAPRSAAALASAPAGAVAAAVGPSTALEARLPSSTQVAAQAEEGLLEPALLADAAPDARVGPAGPLGPGLAAVEPEQTLPTEASPPKATRIRSAAAKRDHLVADVQQALLRQGFDPGPVDGIAGPMTRAAVRTYQRSVGLEEDGVIDRALFRQLEVANRAPAPRNAYPTNKTFVQGLTSAVSGMLNGIGKAVGGLFGPSGTPRLESTAPRRSSGITVSEPGKAR